MTYLFSEKGCRALRALAVKPVLYAFDFDGTLAPISPDRDAVKIPYSMSEWLKELARRAPCAVVSGRALADLVLRIDGAVPYLIGNHGIESSFTIENLHAAEAMCAAWKRDIAIRLAETLKSLGGEVEDKRYSLTVHYRVHAQEAGVGHAIFTLLQQLTPAAHLVAGISSVNVLPPRQGGKGPKVLALMRHLRQTGLFYIGDEETDETVFELTEGLVMGVRIGRQAKSQAKFYLHDQGEVEKVIRLLVSEIDRRLRFLDGDERGTSQTIRAGHDR
jgi:trehalose 6-phosphate phosphatase